MLKIKDNVDLKELEKFGFEYDDSEYYSFWSKYLDDNEYKLFIFEKDRKILEGKFELIFGFKNVDLEEKWIQDLINAGLVEKVSDE